MVRGLTTPEPRLVTPSGAFPTRAMPSAKRKRAQFLGGMGGVGSGSTFVPATPLRAGDLIVCASHYSRWNPRLSSGENWLFWDTTYQGCIEWKVLDDYEAAMYSAGFNLSWAETVLFFRGPTGLGYRGITGNADSVEPGPLTVPTRANQMGMGMLAFRSAWYVGASFWPHNCPQWKKIAESPGVGGVGMAVGSFFLENYGPSVTAEFRADTTQNNNMLAMFELLGPVSQKQGITLRPARRADTTSMSDRTYESAFIQASTALTTYGWEQNYTANTTDYDWSGAGDWTPALPAYAGITFQSPRLIGGVGFRQYSSRSRGYLQVSSKPIVAAVNDNNTPWITIAPAWSQDAAGNQAYIYPAPWQHITLCKSARMKVTWIDEAYGTTAAFQQLQFFEAAEGKGG